MGNEAESCGYVLLVEDEEPIRNLMTRIFERAGYEVISFDSPVEALESASGAPLPDLLVIDLGLPGMSGHELADRFKEQHPDRKILFISGTLEERAASASEGCDFVPKPFGPAELLDKARTCLLSA